MNWKWHLEEILLGLLLGICLFEIPFQSEVLVPFTGSVPPTHLLPENVKLLLFSLLISVVVLSIILLVANKRLATTLGGYFLVVFILGYVLLNKESHYLVQNYQVLRNLGYLFLFVYLLEHTIIHGIAWAKNHSRKIFTLFGVINYWVVFLLITFAYALVTLK